MATPLEFPDHVWILNRICHVYQRHYPPPVNPSTIRLVGGRRNQSLYHQHRPNGSAAQTLPHLPFKRNIFGAAPIRHPEMQRRSVRQNLNPAGIDSAAHDRNFRKEETRYVLAERVRTYHKSGQLHFQGSAPKVDKILPKSLIIIPVRTSMYMLVLWPVEHPLIVNRQMQSEDHLLNAS
ncbi:hypothetical protein C8R48DRAFT_675724 [Suillus tomentosus]|nr:hypothetical protein C8R48DRAFT_675724 [Suillus tomentosus]